MTMEAHEAWPVDAAMRPLVRGVIDASKVMHSRLDDAAQLFLRRGYLDPIQLVRDLPWVTEWETPLREAWEVSASTVMLRAFRGVKKDAGEDEIMSVQETFALSFLEQQGAQLVRDLSVKNRRAIALVLDKAIREGWSIPRIVTSVKQMIGLLPGQAKAVMNRRELLESRGWSEKRIDAALERYSARLLKQRAENIARTETVRALNNGQQSAWLKMEGDGKLPTTVQRVWIPALSEKTCPICMELGSQRPVGLREPFTAPSAGLVVMTPPAHPSCRCSMGLV